MSIRIARFLSLRMEEIGIETAIVPMSRAELAREVLLNQNFDLYVGQFPAYDTPDFLRTLLHSRFTTASGWANPFGYEDTDVDHFLERQAHRRAGERTATLRKIQRHVVRDQPFSVVAAPEEVRIRRRTDSVDWGDTNYHTVESYLSTARRSSTDTDASGRVDPRDSDDASQTDSLEVAVTDSRITENLNPLAVPYRTGGPVIDLLYDPLGRRIEGAVRPWLARDWNWEETDDGLLADVSLRADLTWHDGESLTAADVAFTFRFLADTSLGELDERVPAQRYRGATTLVQEVTAVDPGRVQIRFETKARDVAERALTVPLLPEHVWKERTQQATLSEVAGDGVTTDALTMANMDPVGSGPLRFESGTAGERLLLAPFDDHFLDRGAIPPSLAAFAGGFAFERLAFHVVPSTKAAIGLVQEGGADLSGSPLDPRAISEFSAADELVPESRQSNELYHVGYNLRTEPLDDPAFRRALAQLIDKQYLTSEVFADRAVPAASPLATHESLAPSLRWDDGDPVTPFAGDTGTGSLDVQSARATFRDAGYEYTENGRLIATQ